MEIMSERFKYYEGTLEQFIREVLTRKDKLKKFLISFVSPSLLEQIADLDHRVGPHYKHIIDNSAINHIKKRHSGDRESLRGQVPVTDEDIAFIPHILETFDTLETNVNDIGNKVLIFTKGTTDGELHYIEEIREGRAELAACTLYKTKKETHRR